MPRASKRLIPLALLFTVGTLCRAQGESARSGSGSFYYRSMIELLQPRDFHVAPPAGTPDLLLIDPAVGAGGVRFGMTMDEVVAIWGKPDKIERDLVSERSGGGHLATLQFGATDFEFFDDCLERIDLCHTNLPEARFRDGLGFDASVDDVVTEYGKPKRDYESEPDHGLAWDFMHFQAGGTELEFHFMRGHGGAPELYSVRLTQLGRCRADGAGRSRHP
jgi:hypothetical protein